MVNNSNFNFLSIIKTPNVQIICYVISCGYTISELYGHINASLRCLNVLN